MTTFSTLLILIVLIHYPTSICSTDLKPRKRACYECRHPDEDKAMEIDSESYNCEDVDALTGRLLWDMGEYYCLQFLRYKDSQYWFFRGKIEKSVYGDDWCGTHSNYLYCFQCDSDLCNNANAWRPTERWYWDYPDHHIQGTGAAGAQQGRWAAAMGGFLLLRCFSSLGVLH